MEAVLGILPETVHAGAPVRGQAEISQDVIEGAVFHDHDDNGIDEVQEVVQAEGCFLSLFLEYHPNSGRSRLPASHCQLAATNVRATYSGFTATWISRSKTG